MDELVFDLLKEKRYIDPSDVIARNEIMVNNEYNDVVIKGNKRGLILLADYLVQIAISDKPWDHVHLDLDNFFDAANCELIISKDCEKS